MKPHYARSDVQPVAVEKAADDKLSLSYHVLAETQFYSKGVNYVSDGSTLKIYIDRCELREACAPMAQTEVPLDDRWTARVSVPYKGEQVVLVHADGEERIYP